MKISIDELHALVHTALTKQGHAPEDADFIIEVYLGGELRGHKTHGLAPFPTFAKKDFSHCEEPVVLAHTHSLYLVDAKSNCGITVGRHAADIAIDMARTEGVAMAMLRQIDDWVRPGAIAEYVARQGMLAIVTNDGSGSSIAPPGGYEKTVGTNPLAFGIETRDEPLVVEMATSKRARGHVRLARKYGTPLPEDTYYTPTGEIADTPEDAFAVKPFGEHKGFAIALLIEIMNGSLIGDDMMITSDGSTYESEWPPNSGFILVINPEITSSRESFIDETSNALDFIRSTKPFKGETIRIPGENAGREKAHALLKGTIEVPDDIVEEIRALAQ